MHYKLLGQTSLKVSEVGFGGIPIMRMTTDEAVQVLQRALERGINFFDTANAYTDSEEKMGQALTGRRSEVVIATKTIKRDAAGAAEQIDLSLRRLRTDYIDLYQFHQVSQESDWQAITGPGGAMEAVVKAKEAGKIRHIGITAHNLAMAIKLVKTGLFATIQFPFSFLEPAARDELFAVATSHGLGILAMKPFGGGVIESADLAFKFLRQYPEVLPIPGFHSEAAVDEIVDLYAKPNTVSPDDLAVMERLQAELGKRFCRRCEYCLPCPQGVIINAAMIYPVAAARMSPAVASRFSKLPMESVANCIECGLCVSRCPYELPIPDLLKEYYALYQQHSNEAKA